MELSTIIWNFHTCPYKIPSGFHMVSENFGKFVDPKSEAIAHESQTETCEINSNLSIIIKDKFRKTFSIETQPKDIYLVSGGPTKNPCPAGAQKNTEP